MPMPAIGTSSHKASSNPKQACQMATYVYQVPKVRRQLNSLTGAAAAGLMVGGADGTACSRAVVRGRMGGSSVGSYHLDLALAVLNLGLEPLQVRNVAANLGNVAPAAAELHDGDGAAHEQREDGDDHRQAKRDPDRDDDRRHARSKDGVLCVVLDGEEHGSVAGHVEAFSEHAPHHLHLALHDREQDRLRLCAVLRE